MMPGKKNYSLITYLDIELQKGSKHILNRFNLSVVKGDKLLISGKSGSGKTTLFKLLLGFETPDKGRVLFNEHPVSKAHIVHIRQQIFYLSQDIDLKQGRVRRVIDEVLDANKTKEDPGFKKKWMRFLELDEKILEQNIKKLSGGERQRIGLLLCFLLQRPVWLLDEPTSALDDKMKEKVSRFIMEQDKTVFIISHEKLWGNIRRITIGEGN